MIDISEETLPAEASENEIYGQGDESDQLPGRIQRYSQAKVRTMQMRGYVGELLDQAPAHQREELYKVATQLGDCANYLVFRQYFTVGQVRLHAACFCKLHLLCPLCAIRRGAKSLKAYLDRFELISAENPELKPYLVTITVKNGFDLGERFHHLKKSLQVLHKHRRDFLDSSTRRTFTEAAKAAAGVWSYEVTNKGKGWHPHLHAIWLCAQKPSQTALKHEWEAITKDSHQVDVRAFKAAQEPSQGFLEVFKYAVKFSGLSLADNWSAFKELKGKRLLDSFGLFRGVEVPASLLDEELAGLPYVDLFYQYLPGVGYSFRAEKSREIVAA